ncbi:hypothetical protein [Domibacillus indicus]|uniref:hypothetical protein n=1 Tax=Domibacillus indicus TaxID=1437523 RepID=UPI000617BB4D|nr:hypothetical protein [Domibacillus indicus]
MKLLVYLLVAGAAVFFMYYLPMLAKDSKKMADSAKEMERGIKTIVKQNEEIIELLKRQTRS